VKVLVCDDDAGSRLIVRRLLESFFKCEVAECTNGADALEMLQQDSYSFLFLDLSMPVMDGVETLTQLRQTPSISHLPVIILSGENDADEIQKVMTLGITEYVLKPPAAHAVVQKVERIIKTLPRA
jgi:CheY-like chemotaxis protein